VVQPTSGAIRAGIVDVLRRSGSATRAEPMARTGLSGATVSSLVGKLALVRAETTRFTDRSVGPAARPAHPSATTLPRYTGSRRS
jgi:hypothetical protein